MKSILSTIALLMLCACERKKEAPTTLEKPLEIPNDVRLAYTNSCQKEVLEQMGFAGINKGSGTDEWYGTKEGHIYQIYFSGGSTYIFSISDKTSK